MQLFAFGLFEISLQLRVPFQRKGTAASGLHGLLWWLKGWLSSTRAGWCAGECSRSQSSLFYGQVSSNPISWSSWASSWASFRHSASSFFDSVEFVPIFEAFGPSTLWLSARGDLLHRNGWGKFFGQGAAGCLGHIVNLLIEPWKSWNHAGWFRRGFFFSIFHNQTGIWSLSYIDLWWFFKYQSLAPFDAWCLSGACQPPTGLGPGWGRKSVTKRKVSSV